MEQLLKLARQTGFSQAAVLEMSSLHALAEVREMCAADRCHQYGTSWSCPPACGTLEQCQQRMEHYRQGILVQTTGELADDFDLKAIQAIEVRHKQSFFTLTRQIRLLYADCLPLTAGTCTLCRTCTYPDKPCRFPKKRFSSMEAYGLLVSDICTKSGLRYYYGPQTMTYTACILLNERKGRDSEWQHPKRYFSSY